MNIYDRLDANLKPGQEILVMTKFGIVQIKNSIGRGCYAEVVDTESQFDGGYVFGERPSFVLWQIENKLAALTEEVVIH